MVIGVVGVALGLAAGLVAASGLAALLDLLGLDLPARPIELTGRTVLVAAGAGLVTTLLAAVVPALRATRVVPLAALRGAVTPPREPGLRRPVIGAAVVLGVAGAGGLLYGSLATDAGSDVRLAASSLGALVLV